MKKITVIIPCYNEATSIAGVITRFPKDKLNRLNYDIEIIVIDNNSNDDTSALAKRAGARVVLEPKKGKGNAVRTGLYSISPDTDFVVMLDGDGTYASDEILRLLEPIESGFSKVIIGSRMFGRINTGSMKPLNKLGNKFYSQIVRSAYKIVINDALTGYYAWSMEVVEKIRPFLVSEDFTIEMEMITKMARLGYQIYCVPISYDSRLGDSNLKPLRDGSKILKTYVKNLRWHPEETKYGLTDRINENGPMAADMLDDYRVESKS